MIGIPDEVSIKSCDKECLCQVYDMLKREIGEANKKCYFDKNLKNKIFPKAFQSLSITTKNTDGSVRSIHDVLSEIADKYVEMGNSYYD